MKDIQFLEVGMKNYGPYREPMILEFKNDTLTLITGANGIGKTMAIDAIPFTLYGVTSKGARGDDVVNNKVGKNCKTWVKLLVNGVHYVITRYHKYSKFGNTVIINCNGKDIKQGHKECLPYIERLVCPQKAFMNALMFGQKVKDFFTDLVDSQKKEIFRKILDIEMFLTYYKFADVSLKDIIKQAHDFRNDIQITMGLLNNTAQQIEILREQKNNFYNERENEIKEKEQSLKNCERLLSGWASELEKLNSQDINLENTITEIATIKQKINSMCEQAQQRLKELKSMRISKISDLTGKAKEVEISINERYNELLTDLQNRRSDLKEASMIVVSTIKDEIHTFELQRTNHMGIITALKERIAEIKKHVLDADISECPLCEQAVDEETIETLQSKVGKYQADINTSLETIDNIAKSIEDKNEELNLNHKKLKEQLDIIEMEERQTRGAKNDELVQNNAKLSSTIKKVEDLSTKEEQNIKVETDAQTTDLVKREFELAEVRKVQEKNIQSIKTAEENLIRIKQDQTQFQKEIKELQEEEYDETQLKSYLAKEIEYKEKINASQGRIAEYDKLEEVISFWKSGFSQTGIPSMLIDESIPYMNERVDHYLDLLTNGRYVVSFDTLSETKAGEFRDKISVHVLDTQTQANSRVQLSGGQTRIIDISIILTLGDLLSRIQDMSFNLLLFDEIFDALDEQNIQYVSKVLSKLKIGKSIYIISHQHQDNLEADEILAFS